MLIFCAEARQRRIDDKAADAAVVSAVTRFGPDDGDVRLGSVGDPHLATIDDPAAVGLLFGPRDHPCWIRPVVGFGEAEAADHLGLRQLGEVVLLLRFRSEREDRIHHEGALHGREGADTRVAALELLHDQAVGHARKTSAAVLLGKVGTEHAQFGHLGHEFIGKAALHVALADDRQYAFVDKFADRIADRALLFGKRRIDVEQVGGVRLELDGGQRRNRAGKQEISCHLRSLSAGGARVCE